MTPEQITFASRRLRLGITNVGFWVLSASAGLYGLVNHSTHVTNAGRLAAIAAGAVAVQAVFDVIGGTRLMPEPRPS